MKWQSINRNFYPLQLHYTEEDQRKSSFQLGRISQQPNRSSLGRIGTAVLHPDQIWKHKSEIIKAQIELSRVVTAINFVVYSDNYVTEVCRQVKNERVGVSRVAAVPKNGEYLERIYQTIKRMY